MLLNSGLGMGMESSQCEPLTSNSGLQPHTIHCVEPLDPGALSLRFLLRHAEVLLYPSLPAEAHILLLGAGGS